MQAVAVAAAVVQPFGQRTIVSEFGSAQFA